MKKQLEKKIEKAKKEIDEAEDAVLNAAKTADEETKEHLARAEMALEKAESEVIESQN